MFNRTEISILVVDDDKTIANLIKDCFKRNDFKKIDLAHSGTDALEKLKLPAMDSSTKTLTEIDIDVVILDIILPDANGFDICRRIKDNYKDIVVFLISGYDIEELQKRLISSGADDFLTKPFSSFEIVTRVELLLEKKQQLELKKSKQKLPESLSGHQLPHIGDMIDNYMIVDALGWGKSSVIYKVVDTSSNSIFAIKLLTKYALDFKDIVQRFDYETSLMAKIDHPNIIKSYSTGKFDGCPYIVMQFINGTNLQDYPTVNGTPSLEIIFKTSLSITSALGTIHEKGIIHRDIKPQNIMMEVESENIILSDFGISKELARDIQITEDDLVVGTPMYMAPELFKGAVPSPKSDIYSFGVTIYQFTTSFPPFSAKNPTEIYKKHLRVSPKLISEFRPDIPYSFDELIVEKCLAKKPEARPESCEVIHKELKEIADSMDLEV